MKYSHAYTIAFEVESNKESAKDVTPAMFRQALAEKLDELGHDIKAWRDAATRFDTMEVEEDTQ